MLGYHPTCPPTAVTLALFFDGRSSAQTACARVLRVCSGQFRWARNLYRAGVLLLSLPLPGLRVTILAPALVDAVLAGSHFSIRDALGLLTGAGSLGLCLPPCLPLRVVCDCGKFRVKCFLGAIVSGVCDDSWLTLWGLLPRRRSRKPQKRASIPGSDCPRYGANGKLFIRCLLRQHGFSVSPLPWKPRLTALYALRVPTVFTGR